MFAQLLAEHRLWICSLTHIIAEALMFFGNGTGPAAFQR